MKTVQFIVKQKPEMTFVKWDQDEGNGEWWCEDKMESDYQLEKGDYIYVDNLKYCVDERAYHLDEDLWAYYLDPVYVLNREALLNI